MKESFLTIRPLEAGDEAAWRALWADYCRFYETTVPETVTAHLWRRLIAPDGTVRGVAALNEAGTLAGFAHYVLHPHTWSEKTLCYLEDLYVAPEARGQRIASRLIEHLMALGREKDWKRVYWHTDTHNETARRVYDRFAPADDYVRYTIAL